MPLRPNPSFFSQRLAPAHFNQVIESAAYDPSCLQNEETSSADLLCPVRHYTYRHYPHAVAAAVLLGRSR